MPVDLMTLGSSALRVSQRALSTTSHNIANAGTAGYSRQRVDLTPAMPSYEGGLHFGQGVQVENVQRIFDGVLNDQIVLQRANRAHAQELSALSLRIDQIMSNPDTGLNGPLQQFFTRLEEFTTNPGDPIQGQLLLNDAEHLATKFGELYASLESMNRENNARVVDLVDEINIYADSISTLNQRLAESPAGASSNDMLDQRDELVRELSDLVSVSAVVQDGGPMNVYLDGGHALVVGTITSHLQTGQNIYDASRLEVMDPAGSALTQNVGGGQMGGLAEFRTNVLDPTFNALGRLAVGLTEGFNAQHRLGLDKQGALGGDFFTTISPLVNGSSSNTGTGAVTGAIANANSLTLSDYVLVYDGADNYTLTRETDGTTFAINTGGAPSFTTGTVDGFTLNITAGAALGDRFRISPTVAGAQDFAVGLTSPTLIAAALPVQGEEAFTNLGSGFIHVDQINATANLPLSGAPVSGDLVLTFDAGTNTFNLGPDPLGEGPLSFDPAVDVNGRTYSLLGGDLQITLSGVPINGDQFTLTHNTGASGDNRNALKLAELSHLGLLDNGTSTLEEALASQIANVGSQARDAERSEATFSAMLEQAFAAREQISGVNLDEEAANLIRYQQSYQAAAEILRVSDELFQSLIRVIQR